MPCRASSSRRRACPVQVFFAYARGSPAICRNDTSGWASKSRPGCRSQIALASSSLGRSAQDCRLRPAPVSSRQSRLAAAKSFSSQTARGGTRNTLPRRGPSWSAASVSAARQRSGSMPSGMSTPMTAAPELPATISYRVDASTARPKEPSRSSTPTQPRAYASTPITWILMGRSAGEESVDGGDEFAVVRFRLRAEARRHLTVRCDDELLEVPLDVAAVADQPPVERVPAGSVDLDLLGQRKGDAVVRLAEVCYVGRGARLLRAEFIAGDAQNHQAPVAVGVVE